MKKFDFVTKFKHLIKEVVPYYYPETKDDYVPDFSKPISIETSILKNIKTYLKAKKAMKRLNLDGLEWTYNNLEDEYSKQMMLEVLVYKLFNEVKLRFPLYYNNDLARLDQYEQLMKVDDEEICLNSCDMKLKKYNLESIGYDLKIWFVLLGIFVDFMNEQYSYSHGVEVEEGDYVIDGGSCYGDTALYFAAKKAAKIFSFEFIDENLDIFNRNIELNPQYKNKITIVQSPLGAVSGEKFYAVSSGPGTSLSTVKTEGAKEFETISIDDFVEKNNIEKIDFIKLDIEGCEMLALAGAVKTIRKFKPKLAICVYHKHDDLWTIPQYIKEILPEYKLFFDHKTIHSWETLVYAKV